MARTRIGAGESGPTPQVTPRDLTLDRALVNTAGGWLRRARRRPGVDAERDAELAALEHELAGIWDDFRALLTHRPAMPEWGAHSRWGLRMHDLLTRVRSATRR